MNWLRVLKGRIRPREKMNKHTTFKIGGPARFFIEPKDIEELKMLLKCIKRYNIPFLVIGRGSNILVGDKGVDTVVLKLSSPVFRKISLNNNHLKVGCAATLNQVISVAQKKGLGGLEFLAGIPGTLGGALVMNAGAWSKNIGELIEEVRVMDGNGRIKKLSKEQIKFAYRKSNLEKYIILSAILKLVKTDKSKIKEKVSGYLEKRKSTQDLSRPSAGCIFKNPKGISAGRLIDLCNLKGTGIGGARISLKHANFILNEKNATAEDVLKLMSLIKKKVKSKFNISLKPEIKIWQ